MKLADRVRLMLMKVKPGYGQVDTEESDQVANRADARGYLQGRGPYQHFSVEARPSGSPYGLGRVRKKRAAARERVRS